MVQLLVFADDLTGALDTAVQFSKKGIRTAVQFKCNQTSVNHDDIDVLVINTNSRHVSAQQAYEIVKAQILKWNNGSHCFFYKKTDSALRGNIGAECRAIMDTTPYSDLYFLPAFPDNGRTTYMGTQYYQGIPVHKSLISGDILSIVETSHIPTLLEQQMTDIDIVTLSVDQEIPQGNGTRRILVFDSRTNEDMQVIAQKIRNTGNYHLLAGCAGFAQHLPELLHLKKQNKLSYRRTKGFLYVCGSINPVSTRQLECAEKAGFTRLTLTQEQKLMSGYFDTPDGKTFLQHVFQLCENHTPLIIDVTYPGGPDATSAYAKEHCIPEDQISGIIVRQLGVLIQHWVKYRFDATLMISGGDTLMALADVLSCRNIDPVCEISSGSVLSQLKLDDQTVQIVSKSGGFGTETEIVDIWNALKAR